MNTCHMNKTVWRQSATRTSLVFACLIASAQGPARLSTTENGWEIDFTTQYRFRGSDQPLTSKLFRIGPRGLELVDERANAGRDLDGVGTTYATNYGDPAGKSSTTFTTPSATFEFDGQGQVSANGRWGVTWGSSGLYRVDLNTGHREVAGVSPGGLRSIASDGSALAGQDGRLLLVRPDKTLLLPSFNRPYDAVLSDNGKFVAVDNGQFIFLWRDGSDRFEPIDVGRRPFLSYDGTRLAWLGPGRSGSSESGPAQIPGGSAVCRARSGTRRHLPGGFHNSLQLDGPPLRLRRPRPNRARPAEHRARPCAGEPVAGPSGGYSPSPGTSRLLLQSK
jgi:hypothetical protein